MTDRRKEILELAAAEPCWAQELMKKAQREYKGEHILPGTGAKPFFVGNPPKWQERAVTDKEYLWTLNRMYHWNDFIIAYYISGEGQYGLKLKEELTDWIRECPPPEISSDIMVVRDRFANVSPWRSLEVGIRMFEVWPYVIRFLREEGFMDQETQKMVALSFHQHGVILRNIPPMLWPKANHNHYLMENLGLLYICYMFPEFSSVSEWMAHANVQIEKCAENQLCAEGAQIEGCPTYHNICMRLFCLWIILAEKLGITISDTIRTRIEKGIDYSLASFRPCGGCVPWGDSDAEYNAVKAAVLGYRAFHKNRWIVCLKELIGLERLNKETADCILEAGYLDLLQLTSEKESDESLPLLSFQKEINQVSYRTSWKRNAYHIHFGCQMPGNNGHAHTDLLSFDFSALGRPMAVDPGRFTYDEASERRLFKSAEMHNCLTLNHQPPYEYLSSWRFGEQHDGCIISAKEEEGYFWAQ